MNALNIFMYICAYCSADNSLYLYIIYKVLMSESASTEKWKSKNWFYTYSMHHQQQPDNSPRESAINHGSLSIWKIKILSNIFQIL